MKDKKYNNYFDNYTNRVKTSFIGGLGFALLFGLIYGIYKLVEWLIS